MNGTFRLDLISPDGGVSATADNILLDAGIAELIDPDSFGIFAFPRISIGSSDYPTKPEQPGLLSPFLNKDVQILTYDELSNNHPGKVFFTATTDVIEEEGNSQKWAEVTYKGYNRALFSAPGNLPDDQYHYVVTSFNQFGESLVTDPQQVVVSSTSWTTPLTPTQGLTSMPHEIKLLNPSAPQDTITIHFFTLVWATGVNGICRTAYARTSRATRGAHSVTFFLNRADGLYYYRHAGNEYLLDQQPSLVDQVYSIDLPSSASGLTIEWTLSFLLSASNWPRKVGPDAWKANATAPVQTEVQFWGSATEMDIETGGFLGTVEQSFYKVHSAIHGILTPFNRIELPNDYGHNTSLPAPPSPRNAYDLINTGTARTNPEDYPPERDYYKQFDDFWTRDVAEKSFPGEVFEAPGYFRITMWYAPTPPGDNDRSSFQVKGPGTSGTVFIEWDHTNQVGPSGWPTGYRVYRRKPDLSYGRIAEIPATFSVVNNVMTGSGETHFWDRGEVSPGVVPVQSGGPARPPSVTLEAKQGPTPKKITKTDLMRGKLHLQMFFADAAVLAPYAVSISPPTQQINTSGMANLSAFVANDYGETIPGLTLTWEAPDGGVVTPSGDTLSATFTHNVPGTYTVIARHLVTLSASAQVVVVA